MKGLAAASLVASVLLLVVAKLLQPSHPAFGFVAAFAEAATIGGLADWYAVVALFRRPLGLPIPHTAIIPHNQTRIADKLGEFIETNFLAQNLVAARLRDVDFAGYASEWLSDRKRSAAFAQFILQLLPGILSAVEKSGLKVFLTGRIADELRSLDLSPLARGALEVITADNRHQRLLDEVMRAFSGLLTNRATLDALRDKIRKELPTLLILYRADSYLLKKIVGSVASFVESVRTDDAHPFRGEFDRFVRAFVSDFDLSAKYAERLETLKRDLLARPELADLATSLWANLGGFVEASAAAPDNVLAHHLQEILMDAGRQLAKDPHLGAEINQGVVVMLARFIENQKSGVSKFVAEQVKSWDLDQLVHLVETNVGVDLQYIRFNGAIIGGLAGLALYTIEYVLRLM